MPATLALDIRTHVSPLPSFHPGHAAIRLPSVSRTSIGQQTSGYAQLLQTAPPSVPANRTALQSSFSNARTENSSGVHSLTPTNGSEQSRQSGENSHPFHNGSAASNSQPVSTEPTAGASSQVVSGSVQQVNLAPLPEAVPLTICVDEQGQRTIKLGQSMGKSHKIAAGAYILQGAMLPGRQDENASSEGILVRPEQATNFEQISPSEFRLRSGCVFISVRHPSQRALITTDYGEVTVESGADVLISLNDGVVRARSLNSPGSAVKVFLPLSDALNKQNGNHESLAASEIVVEQTGIASASNAIKAAMAANSFLGNSARTETLRANGNRLSGQIQYLDFQQSSGNAAQSTAGSANLPVLAVGLAAGYEFIFSDHTLGWAELRPSDGIGRRYLRLIGSGQFAVNEVFLTSVMKSSNAIGALAKSEAGTRERKALSRICKMAAAQYCVTGMRGYQFATAGSAGQDQLADGQLLQPVSWKLPPAE